MDKSSDQSSVSELGQSADEKRADALLVAILATLGVVLFIVLICYVRYRIRKRLLGDTVVAEPYPHKMPKRFNEDSSGQEN